MGKRADISQPYIDTPPGGKIESGETIEECAAREVLEETGFPLGSDDIMVAGPLIYVQDHIIQPFYAYTTDSWEPDNPEADKNLYWYWMPIIEMFDMVERGEYPNVSYENFDWMWQVAEETVIGGINASSVIPPEISWRYELFADVEELVPVKDIPNSTRFEKRSGTFLDYIH